MVRWILLTKRLFLYNKCKFWPLLGGLVVTIVLIQLVHMALLSRLQAKELQIQEIGGPSMFNRKLKGRNVQSIIEEMRERVKNSYRLDKSGTYHLIDNFLTSEHVIMGGSRYDVSLVTQCSSNHLQLLVELSERFNGPISVAVFTFDNDFVNTVNRLINFHFCYSHIYRHVSFHLVFPISRAPKHFERLSDIKLICSESFTSISTPNFDIPNPNKNYNFFNIQYPNNLLRNLAINYAQTPYVLMIDIDMVPSENLRQQFQILMQKLLNENTENSSDSLEKFSNVSKLSAFVVPVFEIKDSVKLPRLKNQLLDMWNDGKIRPFYWEICQKCQKPTDYYRWRRLKSDSVLSLAYSVERVDPWEPFYIAKTSLPLYDERFAQYGFNRISQVCEMHVAGFTFHVLDNAFLLHKGYKVKDAFHAAKEGENDRNRILYRKFKEELKTKYPNVKRRC